MWRSAVATALTLALAACGEAATANGSGGEEMVPIEPHFHHVAPGTRVHYSTDPPASGDHYPIPGPWGYADRPLQTEAWVHNLEHGGVVILWQPGTPAADLAATRKFIAGAPPDRDFNEVKLLGTAYPVPGHRFALVAWGWRQLLETWDPAAARRFYLAHVDHGRERVP